jgi:transposase-like protein
MAAMKRYTEEQRREVVSDFEASGLGLLAFCRDRGICTGSLTAWRKRYGGAIARPPAGHWLTLPVDARPPRRPTAAAGAPSNLLAMDFPLDTRPTYRRL